MITIKRIFRFFPNCNVLFTYLKSCLQCVLTAICHIFYEFLKFLNTVFSRQNAIIQGISLTVIYLILSFLFTNKTNLKKNKYKILIK